MRGRIISLITLTAIEVDGILNSIAELIPFQTIQKMVTLSVELSMIIIFSSLIVDVGAYSLRLLRQLQLNGKTKSQKENHNTKTQPTEQEQQQKEQPQVKTQPQKQEQKEQSNVGKMIEEIIGGK